jgi:hypothetical protein
MKTDTDLLTEARKIRTAAQDMLRANYESYEDRLRLECIVGHCCDIETELAERIAEAERAKP